MNQEDITFDKHFYKRVGERPINEGFVRKFLAQMTKLDKIEKGRKERFKFWFKMSRKYSLVLIIEPKISNLGVSKEILKNLKNMKISVTYRTNHVYVLLLIAFKKKGKEVNVPIPLTFNLGHKFPMTDVLIYN